MQLSDSRLGTYKLELITKDIEEGKFIRLCPKYKDGLTVVAVRGSAECWMQATQNRQTFILPPLNHRLLQLIAEDEHRKGKHLDVAATVAII